MFAREFVDVINQPREAGAPIGRELLPESSLSQWRQVRFQNIFRAQIAEQIADHSRQAFDDRRIAVGSKITNSIAKFTTQPKI